MYWNIKMSGPSLTINIYKVSTQPRTQVPRQDQLKGFLNLNNKIFPKKYFFHVAIIYFQQEFSPIVGHLQEQTQNMMSKHWSNAGNVRT